MEKENIYKHKIKFEIESIKELENLLEKAKREAEELRSTIEKINELELKF